MNAFTKFNMRELARLTRAGKLVEAVGLLQPRVPPVAAPGPGAETMADGLARARRLFTGLAAAPAHPAPRPPQGARFEARVFAGARGPRDYKLYIPSGPTKSLPVVVMLHGCTQDPDDFALGTRMNEVAEAQKFLVVYPRQPQSANLQKCWNWYEAGQQRREGGEPSDIAGLTREVVARFSADPSRVYVAGLSAGGAAAANMAATYPDVFAAAGVHSGLACGAARDMQSAFAAMRGGGASVSNQGVRVPTIVFHGDADKIVNPVNAEQVISQLRPQSGLTERSIHGETPAGMSYLRRLYLDASGAEVGESWTLHGAGHAWSGGDPQGTYTDPRGPDASREMARFFLSRRRKGD